MITLWITWVDRVTNLTSYPAARAYALTRGHQSDAIHGHWERGESNWIALFQVSKVVTLWWTNIAMENGFIVDFPIKLVIFHCYVSSPEGTSSILNTKHEWLQPQNARVEYFFLQNTLKFFITSAFKINILGVTSQGGGIMQLSTSTSQDILGMGQASEYLKLGWRVLDVILM